MGYLTKMMPKMLQQVWMANLRVWTFWSLSVRSITLLSTLYWGMYNSEMIISEHKPLSNRADKVLKQPHSSGNKLRHPALKYDVNLFQYRAFHYPWTTEGCNQILLCNFKPRDKRFPMFLIWQSLNIKLKLNWSFFSYAGHPRACKWIWLAQIPCAFSLFDLVSLYYASW